MMWSWLRDVFESSLAGTGRKGDAPGLSAGTLAVDILL
jgi:hypothetical protein